jgi:hypothetical protein
MTDAAAPIGSLRQLAALFSGSPERGLLEAIYAFEAELRRIVASPAHEAALERIGLAPLLQLQFQTGGGLGSATAIGVLKTACAPFIAKPANA